MNDLNLTRNQRRKVNCQIKFLKAMKIAKGEILLASKIAGIARQNHYYWIESDSDYRGRFKLVLEECEKLETTLPYETPLLSLTKEKNKLANWIKHKHGGKTLEAILAS